MLCEILKRFSVPLSTTYITCPADPKKTLGIKLPFLVMIIKNLKKYFTFEVQVSSLRQGGPCQWGPGAGPPQGPVGKVLASPWSNVGTCLGQEWSPKQFYFLGHMVCQVFCYGASVRSQAHWSRCCWKGVRFLH